MCILNNADFEKSVRGSGSEKYLNEKGLAILDALDKISEKHSMRQATIALAWLLAQPDIGAPIVSATNKSQLKTLLAALELKLEKDDLELLDKMSI